MNMNGRKTIAVIDLAAGLDADHPSPQIALATKRMAGMTILEWMTRRLQESMLLERVVITGEAAMLPQIQAMNLGGACWMPSPHRESLRRVHDVCQRCEAQWVLLVSASCPLIDPGLTDRLLSSALKSPDADYLGYIGRDRGDIGATSLGLTGQVCSSSAIGRLVASGVREVYGVADAICGRADDVVQMRLLPLPAELHNDDRTFAVRTGDDVLRLEGVVESNISEVSWQTLLHLAPQSW